MGSELLCASLLVSDGCEVSENAIGDSVESFSHLPTYCSTNQFRS